MMVMTKMMGVSTRGFLFGRISVSARAFLLMDDFDSHDRTSNDKQGCRLVRLVSDKAELSFTLDLILLGHRNRKILANTRKTRVRCGHLLLQIGQRAQRHFQPKTEIHKVISKIFATNGHILLPVRVNAQVNSMTGKQGESTILVVLMVGRQETL